MRIGALAALALGIGAAPAGAVTLGQLALNPSGTTLATDDLAQLSVSSGNDYVVPANGTITSWSTNAITGLSQSVTFKVFRKVADPSFYTVVAHDTHAPLASGQLNTFAVSIPVQAGDLIGLNGTNANVIDNPPGGGTPSDAFLIKSPPGLNDGESAGFNPGSGGRLNLQATFEPTPPPAPPSNNFTVAGTSLNKKKGTATLNFTLPGPGDLTGSGPGASVASAGHAQISKAVGAGPAQLVVSAAGKQKKKLRQKGKVTLNVAVTYTPTGGTPKSQSVSVNLKLKKKKK